MTFPDDAGIGATAHRCAQAASERSRSRVVPGGDQEQGGGVGADTVQGEQAGGTSGDERGDELIQALELAVEELRAPAQLPQRDTSGVADDVAGPGPQRRQAADQAGGRVPGEPGAQVVGPGQDQRPGLVDRLDPLGAGAALGDHQRPDRLDCAVPALRRAPGPARLGGPGGTDRIQRVGLALPAAVLAVGAVHFDDPDASRGDVAGQARAVAARALDADQGDDPETAQPAQQAGVPGRSGRELLDAEQPADGIQRGRDMHVGVSVHATGDGTCLYDGHGHPFSEVEGWHAPASRRACGPRPLAQDGQIGTAPPVGAK